MSNYSRLSNIYRQMKKRCYNDNSKDFENYGKRGITVCKEWLNTERVNIGGNRFLSKGFICFVTWSISNGYENNLTLDRIDNNKGYSPDNCRWVDWKAQSRNKRNNIYVIYKGEKIILKDYCDKLNLNYSTIKSRLNIMHWSLEKALTK